MINGKEGRRRGEGHTTTTQNKLKTRRTRKAKEEERRHGKKKKWNAMLVVPMDELGFCLRITSTRGPITKAMRRPNEIATADG